MMLLQNGYYLNLKLRNLKLKQKNLNLKIYKSDFLKLKF